MSFATLRFKSLLWLNWTVTDILRLGTRGSALALWQANWVAEKLRAHPAAPTVEIIIIKTTGDQRQDVPLGAMAGKGVFVREIEAALLRNEIDLAVHSAKDLQSSDPEGLTLAAFCERADPRDALVSPHGSLDALPEGARVATGAPRRVAQLRWHRPDLQFVEIRGNVDTRLAKLERGDADALILACAGLDRLGRSDVITERLSKEISLPQVGQACVAVQCRADDSHTYTLVGEACDHAPTRAAVVAERAFLARMGGGCTAPVAAHAQWTEDGLSLTALVAHPEGTAVLTTEKTQEAGMTAESLAAEVYESLRILGADILLAEMNS